MYNTPEYVAARIIIIKNVNRLISALLEEKITGKIYKDLNDKRIIEIPNSSHLMKFIFQNSEVADRVVKEDLQIHFRRFEDKNTEKEMFIPVVPYFRCYITKLISGGLQNMF